MTKPLEALTAEVARESANILIIVAARLARRECLTPLHALSDLNQKTISTRALRDAIDRVEESLVREAGKIRDGHDRLARKLKESESALEKSSNALLDAGKRVAELESAIINHSNSVHFCEVCGKDDPCATDDVCSAIRAAGGAVEGE